MKKILFYCDTVFGVGGVQRVLAEVAKRLSEEYEVTILTTDDIRQTRRYDYHRSSVRFVSLIYAPVSIWRRLRQKCCSFVCKYLLPKNEWTCSLYARSFFLLPYQDELIEKINGGNYDVAIGVHAYCCLHLAIVRSKLNVPRTVGWMHNSYEAFFEKKHPYLPRLKAFFCNRMVDIERIIVLSRRDQQRYKTELGLETRVIYNPLTMEVKRTARPDNKSFLSVGRFSKNHKGFDLLIEAFALFAKRNMQWHLVIVGEGPEDSLYRSLIAKNGLEDRVRIEPFTNNVNSYYVQAGVCVLASRWEGMPLVLMEAMAHGLPVIASNLPIVEELLGESRAAVLFENGNIAELAERMVGMATSTDLAERGRIAMEYAREFSINNIIKEWKEIIER